VGLVWLFGARFKGDDLRYVESLVVATRDAKKYLCIRTITKRVLTGEDRVSCKHLLEREGNLLVTISSVLRTLLSAFKITLVIGRRCMLVQCWVPSIRVSAH